MVTDIYIYIYIYIFTHTVIIFTVILQGKPVEKQQKPGSIVAQAEPVILQAQLGKTRHAVIIFTVMYRLSL